MKATFDPAADAAYICLADEIAPGGVERTLVVGEEAGIVGAIHLDLDPEGCLLGIEILGARRLLPRGFLDWLPRSSVDEGTDSGPPGPSSGPEERRQLEAGRGADAEADDHQARLGEGGQAGVAEQLGGQSLIDHQAR